jgi:1-aminocyclopropane-1-carboxylate deaminase/D-cysteine desulfhydrase-like pyridoxal-dependent ACC family enzyme
LDVDIRFYEVDANDAGIGSGTALRVAEHQAAVRDTMAAVADEYRALGHRPYVLPSSFHPLAAAAYAGCALEVLTQLESRSLTADYLYVTSTGATQAGLVMGARFLEWPVSIIGVASSPATGQLAERLMALANDAAERLGIAPPLAVEDFVNESFAGPGYGIVTPAALEAIRLLARTEGMFLDPVYTGKGMAGLIAHIRAGRIRPGATVVFVHTGGLPALFAYSRELLSGGAE